MPVLIAVVAASTLSVLAIALSVTLFLGVEKVRTGARTSFADRSGVRCVCATATEMPLSRRNSASANSRAGASR